MKKIFLFSINTVWELIKLIRPLYEIIMEIVNVIKKKEGKEDDGEE